MNRMRELSPTDLEVRSVVINFSFIHHNIHKKSVNGLVKSTVCYYGLMRTHMYRCIGYSLFLHVVILLNISALSPINGDAS